MLRSKLNQPDDAERVLQQFQRGDFPLQAVDQHTITQATALFHPQGSKKNTLFDAVVAAIAKHLNADAIFSFDQWYRKIGLTLAGDLLEEKQAA